MDGMMDQATCDKIGFWQHMHREAGDMLRHVRELLEYYSSEDYAYVKCWQERHAYCYRQIVRHRGD